MATTDDIAARFEQYKRKIDREQKKAKDLKAQADAIEAQTAAQAGRINTGLPDSHACPDCWVERGDTSIIVSRTAADPDHFDRWACPKCGYYFDDPI